MLDCADAGEGKADSSATLGMTGAGTSFGMKGAKVDSRVRGNDKVWGIVLLLQSCCGNS